MRSIYNNTDIDTNIPNFDIPKMPKEAIITKISGSTPTSVPSEINEDDPFENHLNLGDFITDNNVVDQQLHNDTILNLNLSVTNSMNSIRSVQKNNTKHLPTPVPNTLSSHQWKYFLQAYQEGLVFVWEIKLKTTSILAVTKTNIIPLVPNAVSLINVKAIRTETLPLLAKMLNANIMNDQLKTLSILMTGNIGYWRIIGFINSTNNYLVNGCNARPTPETHPDLSEKVNQLYKMLVLRELKNKNKRETTTTTKTSTQPSTTSFKSFTGIPKEQLPASNIAIQKVPTNDMLVLRELKNKNKRETTTTTKTSTQPSTTSFKSFTGIPKEQLPASNIAIQKVPTNDKEIPIVGNHKWLILSLVDDFSHIYVPTWKHFLSSDKIKQAIRIAIKIKKTVRLRLGISDLEVYATSKYKNRIYIGPFPFDKKLDIVLYQNVDGRMMRREDFERSQNIQRTSNTFGCWLHMKNDKLILRDEELHFDYFDKNINTAGDDDCFIVEEDNFPMNASEKIQQNSIKRIKGPLLRHSSPPITSTTNENLIIPNNLPRSLSITKESTEKAASPATPAVSVTSSIKDNNPMSLSDIKQRIKNAKLATQVNNHNPDRFVVKSIIKRPCTIPIPTSIPTKVFVSDIKNTVSRTTNGSPIEKLLANNVLQSTGHAVPRIATASPMSTSMPGKLLVQPTGKNSVPGTTTSTVTSSSASSSSSSSSSSLILLGKQIFKTNRASVGGETSTTTTSPQSSPLKIVEAVSLATPKSPEKNHSEYGFFISDVMALGKIPTKKLETGFLIKIPHYSPIMVAGIDKANEMLQKYLRLRIKEFMPTDLYLSWRYINSNDPIGNRYMLCNLQLLNKEMIITSNSILHRWVPEAAKSSSTSGISSKYGSLQLCQIETLKKARKTVIVMKETENNLKTNPPSKLIESEVILIEDDDDD